MKHIARLARKYAVPTIAVLALAVVPAHAAEGDIDLASVSTGIIAAKTAMIAIAAGIITAGIALGAIKWGGRWAVSLFKIFSK